MKSKVLACCFGALWTPGASAQEPQTRAIDLFEAAKPLDMAQPIFPVSASMKGEEGWVIVNFMIDEQGQAFEPMVVDSMGDDRFIDAAVRALADSAFEPARLSGSRIASSGTFRYTFMLEGREEGARPGFVSRFRRFTRSVGAGEREEAQAELEALEEAGARSLYEDAFLNVARYFYAIQYGSPADQMTYLARALYVHDEKTHETYLPKEDALVFWPQLFVLQAQNRHFVEALDTYEILVAIGADEAAASLADTVAQLRQIAVDDTSYSVAARTDRAGSWHIGLLKDEFYLDSIESSIDEIKLRCEQRYVFFEFEPGVTYRIPSEFGQCELQVLGDADAGFELVQL